MATLLSPAETLLPRIPDRIKVLYVTTLHRTGGWLAEAFAADSASHVTLTETVGATAGVSLLREKPFDAVLVSHEPGVLDALDFVEGLRNGGHEEPMLILGSDPPEAFSALTYEVGADAFCCVEQTTTRSLLWELARAMHRFDLVRENRRLVEVERQRLASEHQEAERLLNEQRTLLSQLETLDSRDADTPLLSQQLEQHATSAASPLPAALVQHYRDLLQTYVVMGSGNLAAEMARLSERLINKQISAQQTMQLHLQVLEEMIEGLGRRSARHVMTRADLLVVEVMVHLADGYRQRYHNHFAHDEQLLLPGFEPADVYPTARHDLHPPDPLSHDSLS